MTTATWWLRSRGRYGLARLAARAPVADSHSLSSFAILLAIFLKPIDVPEIRLNRTPFRESRGSLQTSISHCTWLSVAASPCAHSKRNRSRCSYWHLLASNTWNDNTIQYNHNNSIVFLIFYLIQKLIRISYKNDAHIALYLRPLWILSCLQAIIFHSAWYLCFYNINVLFSSRYLSNFRHNFVRVSTTGSLHTPREA